MGAHANTTRPPQVPQGRPEFNELRLISAAPEAAANAALLSVCDWIRRSAITLWDRLELYPLVENLLGATSEKFKPIVAVKDIDRLVALLLDTRRVITEGLAPYLDEPGLLAPYPEPLTEHPTEPEESDPFAD